MVAAPAARRPRVVLTGGPGGGKTTIIRELQREAVWNTHVLVVPETIAILAATGISPRERVFQRVMVAMQAAIEEALDHALTPDDRRTIICHRGSLDPLAYWLVRGWPEEEFYTYTGTSLAWHHARYAAVLQLVTAADGASDHYQRWPQTHRGEDPSEAVRIDRLLGQVWGSHPNYFRFHNEGMDWPAKAAAVRQVLSRFLEGSQTTA